MRRLLFGSSIFALSLSLSACGSDSPTTSSTGATSGDSTTSATTGAGGSGGAGGGSGGSASNSATSGATSSSSTSSSSGTGGAAMASPEYKSYVILGDSISDKGGVGPFFYNLLATNDNDKYLEWQGKDLKTRYGQDLTVVSTSKAGAVSKDVLGQVQKLPAALPGPVAVTITIGGNDLQTNIISVLGGTDQTARDNFRKNIKDALTELTKPDRFGVGVEVHVFQADIYDPTSNVGDFGSCPSPLNLVKTNMAMTIFKNWNTVVNEEVPKYGVSLVAPLHETFLGHGITTPATNWFHTDCIHPNKIGHNQIRAMFWTAITGEAAPTN